MWDAGEVYELQNSEPPICESAFSLWPTATGQAQSGSAAYSTESGRHAGTTLTDAIRMWNTPSTEDHKTDGPAVLNRYANGEAMTCDMRLRNQAAMWPTASVPNGGRTTSTSNYGPNGEKRQIDLGAIAAQWPTPQRHDAQGGKTPEQIAAMKERTGAGVSNLNESAEHWATPTEDNANNAGGPSRLNGTYRDLTVDAIHWQTPGTDSFRSRGGDRKDEMGLDQEARNWPTASARDWKSGQASEETFNGNARPLNEWAERFPLSHQVHPTHDGPQSSPSVPTSRRRLNPRFVEWLLGFPIGWTEL